MLLFLSLGEANRQRELRLAEGGSLLSGNSRGSLAHCVQLLGQGTGPVSGKLVLFTCPSLHFVRSVAGSVPAIPVEPKTSC